MTDYFTKHGYSQQLVNQFVDIPEIIIDFFKKHKQYIHLPKKDDKTHRKKKITYENIKGENPNIIPRHIPSDPEYFNKYHCYPLKNKTQKDTDNAERICSNALSTLFKKKKQDFTVRERHYMWPTSSTPIRINYSKNGKKSKWPIYAKKADTARILGRFLYGIICGLDLPNYTFNRAIFLEDAVKGNCVDEFNEDSMMIQKEYIEGIIRANCHSDFLELHEDVISNPRNRIIAGYDTVLFDFNLLFNNEIPELKKSDIILKKYAYWYPEFFSYKSVIDIYSDEREKICERVSNNHEIFFSFLKVMNNIADGSKQTFVEKLTKGYEATSLEEFYEKKMSNMLVRHKEDAKKIFTQSITEYF